MFYVKCLYNDWVKSIFIDNKVSQHSICHFSNSFHDPSPLNLYYLSTVPCPISPLHAFKDPTYKYIQQPKVVPQVNERSFFKNFPYLLCPISCSNPISDEVYLLLCQTIPLPGLLGPFTYHCLDLSSSNHMSSFFVSIASLPKTRTKSIKENTIKPLFLLPAH